MIKRFDASAQLASKHGGKRFPATSDLVGFALKTCNFLTDSQYLLHVGTTMRQGQVRMIKVIFQERDASQDGILWLVQRDAGQAWA